MSQMQTPTVRAAMLKGFPNLARSYGLEPTRLLRQCDLPTDIEADPDRRVATASAVRVLELAAISSGADDFGLRLSELRGFSNMGPLSLLARDEPDVRSAIMAVNAYLPLHIEALSISLAEQDGLAILTCFVGIPGPSIQVTDLAIGVISRTLRQLLPDEWRPETVFFVRAEPTDPGYFERTFGTSVAFLQQFNGVVLKSSDLDLPNPMADASLRPLTAGLLRSITAMHGATMTERVRRTLENNLSNRRCTGAFVANQLGVSRRTLNRALLAEETSFLAILNEVRKNVAMPLIGETNRSLTEIADLLGFASPPSLTTWFSSQFGQTPSAWRKGSR